MCTLIKLALQSVMYVMYNACWSWQGSGFRLTSLFMQEMTLDEYEAMMAEKNPKANKDAPKAQVNPPFTLISCDLVT